MPELTQNKLKRMYDDAMRVDEKLFAEQRTNVKLKMGEHYKKKVKSPAQRRRGNQTEKTTIRLTKNYIHRVTNTYENQILETNPSVVAVPFNENELQDVKAAEQRQGIIDWVKQTNNWSSKQNRSVSDFIGIGEVFAKIRFDYSKGKPVAQTEDGQIQKLGEFVIDRVFAFDLKRDPNARTDEECEWWIHDQMVNTEDFKKIVKQLSDGKDIPRLDEKIRSSIKTTTRIFDPNRGEYRVSKDQVLVKELYYKPSDEYPNGWFVMFTDHMIITQMELPFGVFPIVGAGFDELTTSPRSASIIRVCRPYQVEINRSSSKMAEHQITLGDDKVYIQDGSKITNGGSLHGVRAFKISGREPIIQSGRSGAQYLEYQQSQIREMFEAVDLSHVLEDKDRKVASNPYALLFKAMKDKKKFVRYILKYQQFELAVFNKVLEMAKHYLTAQHLIKINGRPDAVNIPEFLRSEGDGFEIKVKAQSGDIEEQFGKVLTITQVLQYAGSSLKPDQLGGLIKQLPYGNAEEAFSTLTVDTDNAMNDILALDRGEQVQIHETDNHEFMISSLMHRMKKSDFRLLPPPVQQSYQVKVKQHTDTLNAQKDIIQRQQAGFIPSGGFLTTVNASMFNPTNKRVERIKIPSEALGWLVKKLEEQGAFTQSVQDLPELAQQQISLAGQQQNPDGPILPGFEQPQVSEEAFNIPAASR